jgi:hypothetical protein
VDRGKLCEQRPTRGHFPRFSPFHGPFHGQWNVAEQALNRQPCPPLRASDPALRTQLSTRNPRLSSLSCCPLTVSAAHSRSASGSHSLSRLLPILPSRELGTRDAFQLRTHAHDDEDGWTIVLSPPAAAAASPPPLGSATPAVHHARDAEGVSARLRADVTIAFADAFSLGALDDAFAPNQIRVLMLHSTGVQRPVLAADTSPALAAPVHDEIDGDGSD